MVKYRNLEESEVCTNFFGHSGECKYCGGIVKMQRSKEAPYLLNPEACWCLKCGQAYTVRVPKGESITEFDSRQWGEKTLRQEGLPGVEGAT
jgi:hypothetical protein